MQAISDFVHAKILFNRWTRAQLRRSRQLRAGRRRRLPADFAHLAIALCRCMNIPARYCTGYLGDIGVPDDVNPMDFSAWAEVFLDGRWWTVDARQKRPHRPMSDGSRPRRRRCAMSTAFGVANLSRFVVVTDEGVEGR